MARGKTLWEMFLDFLRGSREVEYYNPLKAKISSPVTINEVELRDLNFFIKEIREYSRRINRKTFHFTEYVLLAKSTSGEEVNVRLRYNPRKDAAEDDPLSHHVLMLRLYDELAYDEGLYEVVTDTTKKFEVREDDQVVEEFWRINDVGRSYRAKVSVLRDLNRNRKVEAREVQKVDLEYWDYWRDTTDFADQPMREYLFVEMDRDDGWFQIWRGTAMDPRRVMVLGAA